VNTIVQSDLDDRIAAAFADDAKSTDVATLIKHTERAARSAADAAGQARKRALDPTLSAKHVADARRAMDDAAFRRDRLQAAVTRLGERLEHDQLAAELADLYPAVAPKLADLAARIAANDRDIEFINDHKLPNGAGRLPTAELVARGLPGWVSNSIQAPRIVDLLRLPPWHPRTGYFWPPGMN
jgi:hypothetical protein